MLEFFGLLFGCTLVVGSVGLFVVQCGSKSRRAKKQSVKSAKSAKKSAKRAGKKAGQSAKQAGVAAKEGIKEKAQSKKSKRSSGRSARRSSRRSTRRSSLLDAEPSIGQKIANKAQDAKEVVKEKLPSKKASKSSKSSKLSKSAKSSKSSKSQKSQPKKMAKELVKKVMPQKHDPMDAAFVQQQLCVEPRELHFEPEGGIQKGQRFEFEWSTSSCQSEMLGQSNLSCQSSLWIR
ncbi:hypothetical protein M3Y94_00862100 [Aphelenchoides besseyi]|nr:hypothetical protein M3Y94_00862100 [Aphelenchoides besseyi]